MHLRPFLTAMAIGTTLACVATFASAQQVYKWKDANGVVHYSQTPPSSGAQFSTVKLAGAPDISTNTAPAASGQDGQAQRATSNNQTASNNANAGTQPNTDANRKKFCSQVESNITTLQGKAPVVQQGSDGQQMIVSDDQREKQLANAQAQKRQFCSVKGNGA